MAQRRMFSLQVTDTDKFLDMPTSSQALYFHLGLHGDDDGFVASPRKIVRAAGCNDDDLRLLASKGYIIPFESGVVVITDWKVNNYIQSDRYTQTLYVDEKQSLSREKSGRYVRTDTECIQSVSRLETQVRLGKDSVGKGSVGEENKAATPPRAKRFTPPTLAEVQAYVFERHSSVDPQGFIDFYESKGWMVGKAPMKDWKAACRSAESWERWRQRPTRAESWDRVKRDEEYRTGEDFFDA